jgi:acetyl esterase/lipase
MSKTIPLILTALTASAIAQPKDAIPLWPGDAPGALGKDPLEDIPTLTPFWPAPDKATGAAMVICPGGGYRCLAEHEGKDYALWLNERGIAGFVLKYRLGSNGYRHPAMLNDAQRAIRLVRFHAADWKIDPHRIGVMGSSAGGHLASTALTHFDAGKADAADPVDRVSSRPDLGVLCYAVITMGAGAHGGSRDNLLGKNPPPELIALLSNELQVTKETPPCFLWHTREDGSVPVQHSLDFASALQRNGVPYDLHVYQQGSHGLGLGVHGYEPGKTEPSKLLPWTGDLAWWLKLQSFTR